ncbi:hypothetical protein BD311DRAFT_742236 [Dichomitus squalens]|uniref:Uncharacterized protein n=1 Tax=Dichomitus squalens TaxID=114155 RepID=A0A4Q9M9J9_9APHY|nr:hypothetical protein BD311DRAFT_742236 [Dichomitus squalens]
MSIGSACTFLVFTSHLSKAEQTLMGVSKHAVSTEAGGILVLHPVVIWTVSKIFPQWNEKTFDISEEYTAFRTFSLLYKEMNQKYLVGTPYAACSALPAFTSFFLQPEYAVGQRMPYA